MKDYKCFRCGWSMKQTIGNPVLKVFTQKERPTTMEEVEAIKKVYPNLAYPNQNNESIHSSDSQIMPIGYVVWEEAKLQCTNPNCGHIWRPK